MRGKRLLAMVVALAVVSAAPVWGYIIVEDFEEGDTGGFDPAFNHVIHYPGDPNEPGWWELIDWYGDGDWWLGLTPAEDDVTFNLAPGEYVDWAGVTLLDYCGTGCTQFEVVGTEGSMTFQNTTVGEQETYDTTGLDLGEIVTVHLRSYEGLFNDLMINVVPEPATLELLMIGVLACCRR